jgi:RHS repeat-associated protein
VYGNYIDEVLAKDSGSQRVYYHQNALCSVHALTDATGNVVERYSYDAYGAPSFYDAAFNPLPSSNFSPRFLFTGREYDSESGAYHYRARCYSPALGRFMQRDPLGYVDGMNLYEYARSLPTELTDSLGLASQRWPLTHLGPNGGYVDIDLNGTSLCEKGKTGVITISMTFYSWRPPSPTAKKGKGGSLKVDNKPISVVYKGQVETYKPPKEIVDNNGNKIKADGLWAWTAEATIDNLPECPDGEKNGATKIDVGWGKTDETHPVGMLEMIEVTWKYSCKHKKENGTDCCDGEQAPLTFTLGEQ